MINKRHYRLYILAIFLLIIGKLKWKSISLFGKNFIEEFNKVTFNSEYFVKSIYILILLVILFFLFKKDVHYSLMANTVISENSLETITLL